MTWGRSHKYTPRNSYVRSRMTKVHSIERRVKLKISAEKEAWLRSSEASVFGRTIKQQGPSIERADGLRSKVVSWQGTESEQ
jgi:hypothetical protein